MLLVPAKFTPNPGPKECRHVKSCEVLCSLTSSASTSNAASSRHPKRRAEICVCNTGRCRFGSKAERTEECVGLAWLRTRGLSPGHPADPTMAIAGLRCYNSTVLTPIFYDAAIHMLLKIKSGCNHTRTICYIRHRVVPGIPCVPLILHSTSISIDMCNPNYIQNTMMVRCENTSMLDCSYSCCGRQEPAFDLGCLHQVVAVEP